MNEPEFFKWVIAIIAALGGWKIWKIVECFINRKFLLQEAKAKTESIETDSLLKRYSTLEGKIEAMEAKISELYNMVHKLEVEKLGLIQEKMELSLALKESRYNECRRPDDECLRRLPQREICLAKKLLGGQYDKEESSSNQNNQNTQKIN